MNDIAHFTCQTFCNQCRLWITIKRVDHCGTSNTSTCQYSSIIFINSANPNNRNINCSTDFFERFTTRNTWIFAHTVEKRTYAKVIRTIFNGLFRLFQCFRCHANNLIRTQLCSCACCGHILLAHMHTVSINFLSQSYIVIDDKWNIILLAKCLQSFHILLCSTVLITILKNCSPVLKNLFCSLQQGFSLKMIAISNHI